METTSSNAAESWAEQSTTWADSIGENFEQEVPANHNGAAMENNNPTTLFPEKPGSDADYAYAFELPEGVEADSELLDEFASLARENSLPPATARKILDLEVKNIQRQVEAFSRQQNAWRDEIHGDPEFGGARLDSTVASARKALSAYDPDGTLLPELNRTGYGNHPGIVRFLARVGRTLGEDTAFSSRGHDNAAKRPLRDRLWPD